MSSISDLQKEDAKRLAPPAAHRAGVLLDEVGPLIEDIGRIQSTLQSCLEICPHDKAEILRLVDTFKKKAMALHGRAVTASLTIKDGR
ncbi:MAG: hypothetical protein AAFX90_21575 [Pseudomonadota bacterium]